MDDTKREELISKIVGDSFYVCLNMNDVFGYACTEGEELDPYDLEVILSIYEKYGHATLIAYVAVKKDCDPIKLHRTKEYKKAKKEIQKIRKYNKEFCIREEE